MAGLNFGISNVMYYRFMVLRSTHKIEKFQEVLTVNSPERSLTFNRSGIIENLHHFSDIPRSGENNQVVNTSGS